MSMRGLSIFWCLLQFLSSRFCSFRGRGLLSPWLGLCIGLFISLTLLLWLEITVLYWIKVGRVGTLLVLAFRGSDFRFSPFTMILAVCLSYICFLTLRYIVLLFLFHQSFYHKRILNSVKGFSASIKMIMSFLSLILFIWGIEFIDYWEFLHLFSLQRLVYNSLFLLGPCLVL
jgi:hypothetical protein